MYSTRLLIITMIFLLCTAVRDANATQSVFDIVIAAQKNNNALLAAEQELKVRKLDKLKAMSGFLPQVYAQGTLSETKYNNNPAANYGSGQQGQLVASQELFSGGTTLSSVHKTNSIIESAEAKFVSTRDSIIYKAIEAYENVILTRQLYQIAISKEEAMRKHLQTAELKFSVGELTRTDVATAKYNVAEAVAEKERTRGEMLSSESVFSYTIGLLPDKDLRSINASILDVPSSMDEFAAVVNNANPNLVIAKKNLEASEYAVAESTGKLLPRVELQGSLTKSNAPRNFDNKDGSNVALVVSIPIFDKGLTATDIREKRYTKRKAEFDFDDTRGNVNENIVKIWAGYQVAKYGIVSNREALEAAQDAAASADEEYKAGAKTTLDVLTAEISLAKAKASMKKAERDLVLAIFQMHNYMGSLAKLDFAKLSSK